MKNLHRHEEGQMKSFFVGGPNQRKDYHVECGEEVIIMSILFLVHLTRVANSTAYRTETRIKVIPPAWSFLNYCVLCKSIQNTRLIIKHNNNQDWFCFIQVDLYDCQSGNWTDYDGKTLGLNTDRPEQRGAKWANSHGPTIWEGLLPLVKAKRALW